mgnify:CR=1 FL=1
MKKTKKLLACLIAAATMFTMGSTAFAAETEEKLPSDVGTVKITKQSRITEQNLRLKYFT